MQLPELTAWELLCKTTEEGWRLLCTCGCSICTIHLYQSGSEMVLCPSVPNLTSATVPESPQLAGRAQNQSVTPERHSHKFMWTSCTFQSRATSCQFHLPQLIWETSSPTPTTSLGYSSSSVESWPSWPCRPSPKLNTLPPWRPQDNRWTRWRPIYTGTFQFQWSLRTFVNTAVCASPQLMKETPRGLRPGTLQTLNLPVRGQKIALHCIFCSNWIAGIWKSRRRTVDPTQMLSVGSLQDGPVRFQSLAHHRELIGTFLIHPVEAQLAWLVGPTAVHQARQREEQGVGPSGWYLGNGHASQSRHPGRCGQRRGHLFTVAQLTVAVRPPRQDFSSWEI